MKQTFTTELRRLARAESGLAATEFALLLPVMVTLFFGLVEVSDAMTVNRKVAISANTLADLVAQTEQIEVDQMDDLFGGVLTIVEPNDPAGMQLTLVSVVQDVDGDPIVHWSRNHAGATPYVPGADYTGLDDATVLTSSGSLIVVEMTYNYSPSLTSYFVSAPIVFDRTSIRLPRLSSRVQLCDANGENCTT